MQKQDLWGVAGRTEPAREVIGPADVHRILARNTLVDGYPLVLDLEASSGSWLVDAITGTRYLDMFSSFASAPLGTSPPELTGDPEFLAELAAAAVNKPANPDLYTVEYARFVATFVRVLGDPALPHLFFIDGGALAVENALKAAFDWKAKRTGSATGPREVGYQVLHLERAFHGRSGYTLSVTGTEPAKTALFTKFAWPRIPSPALRFPLAEHGAVNAGAERAALDAARAAFDAAADEIACFIAEPIQGEGGDNHLSAGFLRRMQELCVEYDALFVLDEVQTGCGLTGTPWVYQQFDLEPDLVAFGKKTQVCGVMGGRRIDLVPDNVFTVSSRVSSTWGGNFVDMVRATRILEVIHRDRLFEAVTQRGKYLLAGLEAAAARYPGLVGNPRGRGLMCAIDLLDAGTRDEIVRRMYTDEQVMVLPCGTVGLRFRPSLTITEEQVDFGLAGLDRCLSALAATAA
ncbi:MAG: L-lysine 6-transaminase [Pseudonocardiales bacterium]|nr:L-lysine 6-transaminase [Pseudonocardiales bacterium]